MSRGQIKKDFKSFMNIFGLLKELEAVLSEEVNIFYFLGVSVFALLHALKKQQHTRIRAVID